MITVSFDNVNGDVLRLLGEDGPKLMAYLINNIHKTGEWPMDFTEVTMTALKNQKATKCSEHHTVCLTAHAAKTVAGILR
jgi:hypothetical protein